MIIGKTFTFEAAHQLPNDECYGACRNLHGHSYKMFVEVKGDITEFGWVMNFKELKRIVNEQVISKYDHQFLNDFFLIPTAENIVQKIFRDISKNLPNHIELEKITLYETETSSIIYSGD